MYPSKAFWDALGALDVADREGRDVGRVAERILADSPAVADELAQAIAAFDPSALRRAAEASAGGPPTEDDQIAVATAVLLEGAACFRRAREDQEFLARSWDLSRGDLVLYLRPDISLAPEPVRARRSALRISIALGGDSLVPRRRLIESVFDSEARKAARSSRWLALREAHVADLVVVHARLRPDAETRIRTIRASSHAIEIRFTAQPPSLLGSRTFIRNALGDIVTHLERQYLPRP